ncbi:dynein axonemal heavy chain 2 isoform X3 [Moschus berezovskii]|uniref:dynein axonemal heavy chain 2 isoform X3 n=1 Tax=Moschus berezovskii TaxID=68408 RepID=UPI002444F75B|nr:dynein axonemal heavy chain 2 isoform X3 [Moschus berezovskii]
MSSKTDKKRKVTSRGSARRQAAQSALDTQVEEITLPASSEVQAEPEIIKEEPEPILEEPEIQKEELEAREVDVKPLFLSRAVLTGLADATWTEEHSAVLEHFAQDPSEPILTIFIDPCMGLKLDLGMPVQTQNQIVYFIRQAPVPITPENFEETVQFGTVRGAYIPALLRLLSGVFAPQIFKNTTWPESIRNHFASHLHRFLACLTDTRYKLEGHTVLYIPTEAMNMKPEVVVKDKELVQRLETSMIHWTRQIKEVLSAQESVETGENLGPLEEIEFWRNRCMDLSGISKQLVKPGVKHIESILRLAKSSYLAPFMKLAQQIQDGSRQAQSNLTFLSILKEPYQELAFMRPKDISSKLPRLISLIRIIWVNSPHYNTRERLTSLFRKMSNEIIRLCCHAISLDRIFEGYVISSKEDLQGCISCCHAWKDHYLRAVQTHTQFSTRGWILDQTSIFAQVDAFVQRCKDLIEVCDCQYHFARWEDGKQGPLPCFSGAQGPQITRNLLEIEDIFHKNLHVLRAVRGGILDVKNTSWHEDYNRFRAGVKDLEVMTQNLITSAFELVRDVEHGVLLLDTFHRLSAREAIKRTYDKKAVDLYMLFNSELALVNRELNRKWPYLEPYMAQYSGQAHWVRILRRRIDRVMNCLSNAHFLPHIGTGEESVHTYQQMVQAIDELVRKTFQDWTATLDKDCIRRLDTPLLRISQEKAGMLDVNFDKTLSILFVEIDYWERLLFETPHYVVNVAERAEDLRILQENLLLVARDYNRIIAMLSPDEQALFKERIRFLDKKIHPGLKKLHWALKGASAFFITECRVHASKVQMIVNEFKASTLTIGWRAQEISETLLVRISGKRVYRDLEFEEDQREHRAAMQQKLMSLHQDVVAIMTNSYEVFKNDGPEIQQQWMLYTIRLDHMMEDALRLNVKWSLLELSKAINGDGKTTPNPLFRVLVILKNDLQGGVAQVEFSPTLQTLASVVNDIGNHLFSTISVFSHLPEILIKRKFQREPIHTIVERDEDIKKIQAQISSGMTNNASLLQNYLKTWDMYREIWEINKDSFIRRYQRLNPPVSSFDADIARYTEVANNVQKEETVLNIQFVLLDCSHLKFSLVQHCNEWQNKFTTLLKEMAARRLLELHTYLQENSEKISHPPQTLEELGVSLQLMETLQHELPIMETQIPPIHEQFAILEKYEVPVQDNVLEMLDSLGGEWVAFQQTLLDSEQMLKKHKEKFKTGLIHSADDFKKKAHNLLEEFEGKGPFTSNVGHQAALEQIAHVRAMLNAMREEENILRANLGIFKIEQPASKDLQNLEKELDALQQVWEITRDWEENWNQWKIGRFLTLQTEAMETMAHGLFRRLTRLAKEYKDRNWEIIETTRSKIEQFKRTMPLISDLRNPALRERHWDQVRDEVQREFDQESESFTLEQIVQLGMDQHVEKIGEISASATKELAIELALQNIAKTWDVIQLDIVPYKDKGHHRLRGTEEVFQALEDNQVALSTMKASRFVKAFEKDVDHWERCLSLILEVIEMVLTVQRQWMYLENIFLGEDIRKQLPNESGLFDQVNANWKAIMDRVNKDPNALRSTHYPGILDTLIEMNTILEDIQKSLDMYLETKRHIFPRFYFLSNDDLLEILGQSRNPEAVQPHLKKCFDNIKLLRMQKVGGPGSKWEALGMFSGDGEYIDFLHPVLLEGPVESWLGDVERTMRVTLRDLLRNCRLALKKFLNKRDKWVKEWAGQMVITASQIQWTADVTKCLLTAKERADKKILKVMKKKQVSILNKYSEAIRGNLTKIMRLKIVALVTIEVHARDVLEKLYKSGLMDVSSFDWLSQLRFYWEKDLDDCMIRQTNTQFQYGYEYLGNSGRLVITPLTDRCYMTLTTALHLHRGGSPKGPAGTGKTETVKDLGKALGIYVIVVNCSEGLDYKSMGRMYSGLAQTGAWGCFDEFNRINVEVLSVVAQQILSILSALAAGLTRFYFEGFEINLVWSCGIFITMNPGYAGRTELPDNLKSMFRPIAMVVPDSTLIAEIILFGEGFGNCKVLAKKVYTLYSLAVQQLSRQDHYDFGLRALTSLLRYAGKKRRLQPDLSDEEVLLLSMRDMNIAKLTSVDVPLFNAIVQDLFPSIELPVIDYGKVNPADSENFVSMVELTFVFSMIWSVCASVDEEGRKKIDSYLREIEGTFPNKDTVYEYFVDPKMRSWTSFEDKLPKSWRYPPNSPFYKIMVPTVDTVRYNYLVSTMVASQNPVLLVGPVGTGKTSIAQSVLQSLPSSQWSVLTVNMSAQTTSNNVQSIIESRVEKRTKGVYVPFGGKSMITFMDDLNMPAKDMFGSQPPLELIRLWIDYGFWYDRTKQTIKYIRDMFLMAAMGPPGGGRTIISPRLQSRFNIINMTFPTESQIIRIFGTMINQKLQDFEEEVKPIGNVVTEATLDVYNTVVQRFLPTPAKIHYLFNLRDISKVFQGMLRANKDFHDTKSSITRLWIHECFRVFSDRLVDAADMEAFVSILSDKLGSFFDLTFHNLCPNKRSPIFGDFLREPKVYEDLTDLTVLKTAMETALNEYNLSPAVVPMQLVLFREAIEHITRIVRVIGQPRGNMLLVGIGGSGRQSLARLASSICEYITFQIEVTKHYRRQEFREDIKRLYRQAGVELKATSFLFVDTQIADESFLEDINNILSSGEVPNLYKADEFEEIQTLIIDQARAEQVPESSDSLFTYLIERVRNNLHIVLCLSPVGDPFRNWIRQYPALVNCTTINWFSEWPREALLEVAEKYLMGADLGTQENIHKKVAQIFVTMHWSVATYSQKMLLELRRHNYVTPTNYLELVSGYKKLLAEKRQELLDQANKLRTGLFKIDETREKVEVMSLELEDAKKKVAEFQKQCEEYLVIIVQQKREADEQQKAVTANSEKIAIEEVKCQALADNAQKDLEEALPALEEAMRALESLNKKDIGEIKSYGRPPAQVEMVLQAVMILRGNDPTWAEAKRQLGEQNFIKSLIHFDKDNISDKVLKKIGAYCAQPDFQPDIIGRVSLAAKSLCMWVRAMELYGRLYRVVEPKRIRMNTALAQLAEKQAALAEAQEKLREVAEKLEMLKKQYDEKLAQKEELRKRSEEMEMKLERAGMLVSGLAGEKARWEETVKGLEEDLGYLVGDCLLAAAFLSYMGPFLTNYRDEIVNQIWIRKISELQVPCSPRFTFDNFLSNPTKVRDWNIQGLPSDAFSTENGIIVTRGNRWALMIDPQAQALKWIKNMEGNQGLQIIDLQMNDYLRILENAIQFGYPVLLQNVQEYLDPTLNPVLNKSVARIGGRLLMRIGDKEVEYNPNFRFYITTKLSNPHYSPETSAKTTIVNFAVKEQGLEAQLLGIVVRKERPELEEQKDSLVINIAAGKRKLKELEDEILRLLNEATGSLLDDVQLVNTLRTSKITATEVTEQLETSETTEINIDLAREAYRPCAQRASVLFFVLNDMGRIDPMYQFSLDAYISLFILSIDKSHRSNKLEDRIDYLNEYHTYAVYRYTCRTLFERHKLLFSFQMCAKILETSGKLNMDEYNFFLRGGVVLDREGQMDNPCTTWLADAYWDNITELDKLTNFHGLMNSFEQYPRDWHLWYTNATPERAMLPGEWENACNEMQRMLIVRSLRQDRVAFCVTSFIVSNLGSRFIEPPVLNMKLVMEDSAPRTPLVFILSPGVDPTSALLQLAEHTGMAQRFHALSLGQGQAPIAARLLREGVVQGHWVFLANCHLSLSWMPNLDKLVEQLQVEDPHPSFRLWLSSSPHPDFPISILQASIKMTTEPPKGLKANMTRLYQLMTEPQFSRCSKPTKYKKLLFALCFFHSVLLERKKFLQLGWNIIYGFNDSDFEVSENLLSLYLDEYEETPWDALKYLISGVNYGGHVTDDWDRRLLTTYINDYFCDQALSTPFYRLSVLETYFIPKDGSLASYKEYISMLPGMDPPEAFGQHPNADVASQITEARTLFETLLSLQPQITPTRAGGQSREEKVLELAADVKQKIPEMIDYEGTRKLLAMDPSPLNVVLLQEIQRYNKLMETILFSLTDLEKGIQGLIVMSTSLEEIFNCIFDAHVPPLWGKAYPSQKPLASWTRDLAIRVEQFEMWASRARPPVIFWLSGFTFPTGFLTAVLQSSARQNNISVDSLSWEFIVSTVDDSNLVYPPKDGVWVRGLYLEGAGWDRKNSCLVEAEPMQLVCLMPTIHFRPTESRKKSAKGMYSCPCYYYPNRAGSSDRASFVIGIDLRSGTMTSDHWIKRGTALLMSLDN